jgi:zinc transporter ZupT
VTGADVPNSAAAMISLLASIVALGVGPVAYRLVNKSQSHRARVALDMVIIVAVAGIVLLHILPDCFEVAGWPAVVVLVLGLLAPTLIEMWLRRIAGTAHAVVGAIIVVGIAIHAMMDGVGLAVSHSGHHHVAHGLPLAIALHRIPVGLILWWLVRQRLGVRAAVAVLAGIGVTTVLGYVAGNAIAAGMESAELALFQAAVAGALLHVAVHQREHVH